MNASHGHLTRLFILAFYFSYLPYCWLGNATAQNESTPAMTASKFWMAEPGDTGLNRWDPRQLFEDNGVILEWNAKNIVLLREGAKNKTTIPGDNVVRVETKWASDSGERIHRLFQERQFQNVVKEGVELARNAGSSGLPMWQVSVILADMVESSSALGKPLIAGTIFVSLAKENPPQLLLSTIPLPWGETSLGEADQVKLQEKCDEWLSSEFEAVQLLGAAWMISGVKRTIAIEALEKLGRTAKSPLISAYARVQLWRTVPPAEVLSDRLPRWIAERDKLLFPTQSGPTMLLADRLEKASQSSLAVAEWLRVATLHTDRTHLATKAILKASAALRASGQNEQADRVTAMLDAYKLDSSGKK